VKQGFKAPVFGDLTSQEKRLSDMLERFQDWLCDYVDWIVYTIVLGFWVLVALALLKYLLH
jgi:hypothetical protein